MAVFSLSGSGSSRPVDPSSASAGVGWGNIQPKQSLTSMEGPQRPAQPSFHSLQTETAPMNYAESTGNAEDIRLTLFIASSSVIILTLITVIAVVSCFILCNGDRDTSEVLSSAAKRLGFKSRQQHQPLPNLYDLSANQGILNSHQGLLLAAAIAAGARATTGMADQDASTGFTISNDEELNSEEEDQLSPLTSPTGGQYHNLAAMVPIRIGPGPRRGLPTGVPNTCNNHVQLKQCRSELTPEGPPCPSGPIKALIGPRTPPPRPPRHRPKVAKPPPNQQGEPSEVPEQEKNATTNCTDGVPPKAGLPPKIH